MTRKVVVPLTLIGAIAPVLMFVLTAVAAIVIGLTEPTYAATKPAVCEAVKTDRGRVEFFDKKGGTSILELRGPAAKKWKRCKGNLGNCLIEKPVVDISQLDSEQRVTLYRFEHGIIVVNGRQVFHMKWALARSLANSLNTLAVPAAASIAPGQ